MPTCHKCNNKFPNRIKIDGKLKLLASRKFCLECSPYGKHNTSKLIDNEVVSKCECGREYVYDRKKGHRINTCNSCLSAKLKKKNILKAKSYLGSKCYICGYDKAQTALDFHHKDSDTKDFSISSQPNMSWNKIVKEIEKCVLLCCRCHREVHEGITKIEFR